MPSTVPPVTAILERLVSRLSSIALLAGATLSSAAASDSTVTFHRDVVPVLQKNCQACHRPGDIGPMPLLTYEQTRPWAKAIRAAVSQGEMPPWHADRRYGTFANDRSLSQHEIDTLVRWVETGALAGSPADAPPLLEFDEGWRIGTPDVVFEMPKDFDVPADGNDHVSVDHGPQRLHRGQVDPGGRGAPRQPRRRSPRGGLRA